MVFSHDAARFSQGKFVGTVLRDPPARDIDISVFENIDHERADP